MEKELLDDKFHDECGVFGIISKKVSRSIPSLIYYGLFALQHRGEESAGIAVSYNNDIFYYKDIGYVGDIFDNTILDKLSDKNPFAGIGHVRYSRADAQTYDNAHPLVTNTSIGKIAIVLNGSLVGGDKIREKMTNEGAIFSSTNDAEIILKFIAANLVKNKDIKDAIIKTTEQIKGSYAFILLVGNKLIGVRDPHGIRPLCMGQTLNGSFVLSSESCAFSSTGTKFLQDINAGEMVIIQDGNTEFIKYSNNPKKFCIFEHVYIARPDSTIDGTNCYLARLKQGEFLYKEHPLKADMVMASPESGTYAAMGYAQASKIPYGIGLIKNRYIARTFIKPTQELREREVYIKLNPLEVNVRGKDLVLIDDSIVRGTSSLHFVKALKKAGAKNIYFLSACPMVKSPCFLGVDTPDKSALIAANMNLDQMREKIGCDYLGFLSLENLVLSCGGKDEFCVGCFTGEYPINE